MPAHALLGLAPFGLGLCKAWPAVCDRRRGRSAGRDEGASICRPAGRSNRGARGISCLKPADRIPL